MDAAVVCERIERRFEAVLAVAGVDLTVLPGEIYGFLGPNGAGKTTLVRMLCTLLEPTSGRGVVAGHDVLTEPDRVRLRIGVALQEAALDDKQTGNELLRLQGRLYGLREDEIDGRVETLSDLIDIGEAMDRLIATYSGGMKRRLDLAAALVHNPEVLFLDEPTTGLDPLSRNRIWEEVKRLNAELGTTIFLTTQYLEEADELADRVGIIDHGRLVAEGSPEELKRSVGTDVIVARVEGDTDEACAAVAAVPEVDRVEAHHDEIVISTANGAAVLSPVAVALDGSGMKVVDLTLRTPTLDDVFLQLTGDHIQPGEPRENEDEEAAA